MACKALRLYDNVVMAIPHSESAPSGFDWTSNPEIAKERDRWTDWLTDELFDCRESGAQTVRGSRRARP